MPSSKAVNRTSPLDFELNKDQKKIELMRKIISDYYNLVHGEKGNETTTHNTKETLQITID